MLRNKPRALTTTKQTSLMANQPQSSSSSKPHIFTSQKFRFLTTSKITPFDSDFTLISPTSILDTNPSIFSTKNPKPTIPKPQRFHPPDAFGLADLVKPSNKQNYTKPINKMVLFASKLTVQIPSFNFGTKTSKNLRYPCQEQVKTCVQTKPILVNVIEQTEDYTRVISHGLNPTITHIFDNSVFVETPSSLPSPLLTNNRHTNFTKLDHFLTYCYTCNKDLDHNQDIYIYRGEKAFCSSECRYQEMLLDPLET